MNLGKLILRVCIRGCRANLPREKFQTCMELIQRTYSRDLSLLIVCLLTQQRIKSINDVMPMIGARYDTGMFH